MKRLSDARALTWDQIVEHSSRLHTSRRRPSSPFSDELREDSQLLKVIVAGRPAAIVPTRMHEPGFYWRYEDVPAAEGNMRSEVAIKFLRRLVDEGLVREAQHA